MIEANTFQMVREAHIRTIIRLWRKLGHVTDIVLGSVQGVTPLGGMMAILILSASSTATPSLGWRVVTVRGCAIFLCVRSSSGLEVSSDIWEAR